MGGVVKPKYNQCSRATNPVLLSLLQDSLARSSSSMKHLRDERSMSLRLVRVSSSRIRERPTPHSMLVNVHKPLFFSMLGLVNGPSFLSNGPFYRLLGLFSGIVLSIFFVFPGAVVLQTAVCFMINSEHLRTQRPAVIKEAMAVIAESCTSSLIKTGANTPNRCQHKTRF